MAYLIVLRQVVSCSAAGHNPPEPSGKNSDMRSDHLKFERTMLIKVAYISCCHRRTQRERDSLLFFLVTTATTTAADAIIIIIIIIIIITH